MPLSRKPIDFEAKFSELEMILDSIFTVQAVKIYGMNMYQLVYEMCNASPCPFIERAFVGIAEYVDRHSKEMCKSILAHDDIVSAYAREYSRFEVAASYMAVGCRYLDRVLTTTSDRRTTFFAAKKYKKQNVEALALHLWKTNVLLTIRDQHQNRLFYQVFEMIRRDRDGDGAPHSIIKVVLDSLVHVNECTDRPLQLYIEEFERPYLVHTKRYFEAEAAKEIAFGDVSDFMRKASLRLQQEITRNNQYCHSTSHGRIVKEFEAQYICSYRHYIIDEFESMMKEERSEDCSLAYMLLSRLPNGLRPILQIYENYVSRLGKDIVARIGSAVAKNPKLYVDQLLELHTKYRKINQQVFSSDSLCTAAVDMAFRTIINDSETNKAANGPETLARYCDMMMKKNAGKKEAMIGASSSVSVGDNLKGEMRKETLANEEVDVEERLFKVITLFKYVEDKDVFQKFYSRMLAKRLIYGTFASEDLEANMINRLKEICGMEYTSKLTKMFTDISISNDLNTSFKDHLRQRSIKIRVGFDILVLTAGAWPLSQKDDAKSPECNKFNFPPELEASITHFDDFYGKKHSGRRLLWQWNLARAEIKTTFLDRNYELQVGFYQMMLLLLFNATTQIAVKDMVTQMGLPTADVLRSLKPLIDLRVLLCDEPLTPASVIRINESFKSKRTKIKVSATAPTDTQQENAATRKSVDEDRRMYLQAAIVRIMKSRQALAHVQLVQEIIGQANIRFSPSVAMIKKCIEQLLEKQFIARKERDMYVYVA